jgi:hypothetical protein
LSGGYTASEGSLWGNGTDASALFAIRAGLLLRRHELAVEIAPGLAFWDLTIARGPAFEANASYGYLIGLDGNGNHLSWPLRLGLGVLAGGENTGSNVFFEVRLDVIGLRWQTGPWAFDLHAPSFRYAVTNSHVAGVAVEGVTTNLLSFLFGASVSYVL